MRNRKEAGRDRIEESNVRSQASSCRMRSAKLVCRAYQRRLLILLVILSLFLLGLLKGNIFKTDSYSLVWHVDPSHRKLVHSYVKSVLAKECRPSFISKKMEAKGSGPRPVTEPFLYKDTHLSEEVFRYPPPFGFLDLQHKLKEILNLLPNSSDQKSERKGCQRCVVIGNGGILRGLELGSLLNQFDVVIRLNSGPVRNFTQDVGNRTSIRMSYPEGSPRNWDDIDPQLIFLMVIYKSVDFNWLRAIITKEKMSLWDSLFFWQKVPDKIPIDPSQFRILNLEIIRETAMDLLHYSTPKRRLWGWDQNVPTLGVSALNLATYLCDEVSLAGFGYNLSQRGAPLHYYDNLPMTVMLDQGMHNVDRERAFLQSLVAAGTITDLTGGLHCSFCPR
ncbi:lactosylceramide alpha-2,3-sialyltransferase isoform X2 [Chanos chanos]|uniref:Lactosylceramide alpha-2,3-sialyltransferase n=1 Tax=Chanos chanos TaxID=29144 RepID=A0A6J2ULH2_CHACN|nr:lactosylceramide alpha-2,3-sialyltransferase isoform X2 [Chanos chanos]